MVKKLVIFLASCLVNASQATYNILCHDQAPKTSLSYRLEDCFILVHSGYVRYVQTNTKPTNAINQAIERLAFFRFGDLGDHLSDLKST